MDKKLKPCPFCGSDACVEVSLGDYSVFCQNGCDCGAKQEWFNTEDEAIEAWNRRVVDESDRNIKNNA